MDDFEKLDRMLENMIKSIPQKKKELLENVGDILSNQIKQNIDNRVNDSNNHIKDDIEIVLGSKNGYVAVKPSYKKNKINHLIENGHRIVKNGVVVGFVNGKHMYRDSVEQCEREILSMAQGMVDEVIKSG